MSKSKLGRHQTHDRVLERAIKKIVKIQTIEKVLVGRTVPAKHRYPQGAVRLVAKTDAGLKLRAYGPSLVVEIFVTVAPEKIPLTLAALWLAWPQFF